MYMYNEAIADIGHVLCIRLPNKTHIGVSLSLSNVHSLLSGLVAGTKALCEIISLDVSWSYIIMANLFIVLLIEYVSSIRSSI